MIGFMAAFVIVTAVYLVMWKVGNKRGEAKEMERRADLREKGTNPRNTRVVHQMDGGWEEARGKRESLATGF